MRRMILQVLLTASLMIPVNGYAKTFAYIFTEKDEVIKFDTETDSIVSTVESASEIKGSYDYRGRACAVDLVNQHLITLNIKGTTGFYVYNLKTLEKIKFVQFPNIVNDIMEMKIIYPQIGTKFYVQIEDTTEDSEQFRLINLAYDKKTFNFIGAMDNILEDGEENFWFSEDQSQIYTTTKEGNLRIYNVETLALVKQIDFSNTFAPSLWGKSINDINNDVVHLSENKKTQKTDKENYYFLTYKISDSTQTLRILTDVEDKYEAVLFSSGSKVVYNEIVSSSSGLQPRRKGMVTRNQLHVYDVKTGEKIGKISFDTKWGGAIKGIRPNGDKLYYILYDKDEAKIKLYVIDLINYRVIKEMPISDVGFMVFFEE